MDPQSQSRVSDIRTGAFPAKLYDGFSIKNSTQAFVDTIQVQDTAHDGFSYAGSDFNGSDLRSDANGNNGYSFRWCKGMYVVNVTGFGNGGNAFAFYDDPTGPNSNNFFLNLCADSSGSHNFYAKNLQPRCSRIRGPRRTKIILSTKARLRSNCTGGKVYDLIFTNFTAIYNNYSDILQHSSDTDFLARISFTHPTLGTPPPLGVVATGFGKGASSIDGRTGPGDFGVLIVGGTMTGNATGPHFASPGADLRIRDVRGVTPRGIGALTVGASPWTYTSAPTEETFCLKGGTVSAVNSGGSTILTSANACVPLDPNRAIQVTYSVAPTASAFGR